MSVSVKQMMVSILNLSQREKISLGKSSMLRIKTLLRKRGINEEKKISWLKQIDERRLIHLLIT